MKHRSAIATLIKGGKAQVSVEFLLVASLLVLMVVVLGMVVYQKYQEYADLELHITGRDVSIRVAENVNQLVIVGDGYSKRVTLKPRYRGDEFNITFSDRDPKVFVKNDWTWYMPLLTTQVYCCNDICDSDGQNLTMHLNASTPLLVSNHDNKIFMGHICPQMLRIGEGRINATGLTSFKVGVEFHEGENPISPSTASLIVDGVDVTTSATITYQNMTFEMNSSSNPLYGLGEHTVLAYVEDEYGLWEKDLWKLTLVDEEATP